ncbi:hypothetical protein HXX76_006263 [Chlamydomonas incerta]|uniref:UspA domain-containing protein n=1 Tax=Chlamydomonas incerta TaxID=51695 RepID=A0A835W4G3_CHLIN|nr:hypothetical protein HXX76_006263 [Chlamydomonas incerta]|eukprot:KAG2436739.1 hypothetical protein HXX76_006263 [Chlamydomonas incerta]
MEAATAAQAAPLAGVSYTKRRTDDVINPLDITEAELKRRQGPSLTISCAVDGSQMSDKSMATALSFFNSKRGDKFNVIHISDMSKNYLSKHLTPSHLKNYYVDMAHGARVKAEWLCREKEEGRSTCESLTRLAEKHGTDLLVLGSWGRKGEKLDMLGTVSDFSLRQSHCSIVIVRSVGGGGLGGITGGMGPAGGAPGAVATGRPAKYLFATDGSHAAHLAFTFLLNYLLRPCDSVQVLAVHTSATEGAEEARTTEFYKQYMERRRVSGGVHVRCVDRLTTNIPEGIAEGVTELGCDVLVMGISGYGRKKLGSVSADISTRASCTTIIIKDSWDVQSDRYQSAGIATMNHEVATSAME